MPRQAEPLVEAAVHAENELVLPRVARRLVLVLDAGRVVGAARTRERSARHVVECIHATLTVKLPGSERSTLSEPWSEAGARRSRREAAHDGAAARSRRGRSNDGTDATLPSGAKVTRSRIAGIGDEVLPRLAAVEAACLEHERVVDPVVEDADAAARTTVFAVPRPV